MAFIGVVVIAGPTRGAVSFQFSLPLAVALLGGITAGAAYTLVRYLGQRQVAGSLIVWFFSAFSVLTIGPFVVSNFVAMDGRQLALLLGAGLAASLGQYCITYAYRAAPAREISIYDYTNVVFSALLSFLFLGEVPASNSLAGGILIFAAALMMFLIQKREEVTSPKNA